MTCPDLRTTLLLALWVRAGVPLETARRLVGVSSDQLSRWIADGQIALARGKTTNEARLVAKLELADAQRQAEAATALHQHLLSKPERALEYIEKRWPHLLVPEAEAKSDDAAARPLEDRLAGALAQAREPGGESEGDPNNDGG